MVVIFFYASIELLFPILTKKKKTSWYISLTIIWMGFFATAKSLISLSIFDSTTPLLWAIAQETTRNFHFLVLALVYFLTVKLVDSSIEKSKVSLSKTELELSHARMILSPHFIFNCLSTISAEYYHIAEEPSEKLAELSSLLAYGVSPGQNTNIALSNELSQVKRFLEFQKYRFGKHLALSHFDTTERNLKADYKIPKMVLLTLVENVFKHGVPRNAEFPASISSAFEIHPSGSTFIFTTSNKKSDSRIKEFSSGSGLFAISKLLDYSFGSNASLQTLTDSQDNFITTLKILYHENHSNRIDR
jgi:LytS/YehU family sensor histidine kinase